ncbi:MAG: histidine kinase [Anaerolineales bacterium]|nr:histidine kinase [Anaerolineales bacterium]
MNESRRVHAPASRRILLPAAALLLTLGLVAWELFLRRILPFERLSPSDLLKFRFEPYQIGIAVGTFIIPLFMLYLFSQIELFQQILTGQPLTYRELKLVAILGSIQVVASSIEHQIFPQDPDMYMLGLLLVIVAGLLGGLRTGLGVGLVSLLVIGAYITLDGELFLGALPPWPEELNSLSAWLEFVLAARIAPLYHQYLRALLPIWVGFVTGVYAELMGERRSEPLWAWLVGTLMGIGSAYLLALMAESPDFLVGFMLPTAIGSGLATLGVALLIRNLQVDINRRKADQAELAMAQAELRALRAQINPHFLFNALNTIRYCVRTDPEAARHLLLDLSEVFQHILRSGDFVPLSAEIEHVQAYLALEQARLGERLSVHWTLPPENGAWKEQPVPTLILQPIVENAIVHGLARKSAGGSLHIAICQQEDQLVLRVEDNGVGMPSARLAAVLDPQDPSNKSIGLRNVDGRLRALYGDACRLRIESHPGQGTQVELRIPRSE